MPPKGHALLSASSAHRWLNCTPSARLEEQYPDKGSSFAAEGSLAHELAELKLRQYFTTELTKRTCTLRHNKIKKDELYQAEMETHTDRYLEYVKEIAMAQSAMPFVAIESKVDFSAYVPEGFGTADCIVISGDQMHVMDFKYGKGVPVSAEENPQMMLYALGALNRYALLYNINTVTLSIVQPRIDNMSEWSTAPDALYGWAAEYVQPRAKLAYDGKGAFAAGEHCRFCKARAQCSERAVHDFYEIEQKYSPDIAPALLSDSALGDLLHRAEPFKRWLEDVQNYALSAVLDGKSVPGWKAVEGVSRRKFDDVDAAFADLTAAGVQEIMLYERKPLTLAAVEKLLGKQQFNELCGAHVIKPAGKPTLVPESDKRPAYSRAATDFENIETK